MQTRFSLTDTRTGVGFSVTELANGQTATQRTDNGRSLVEWHPSLAAASAFAHVSIRAERLARGVA